MAGKSAEAFLSGESVGVPMDELVPVVYDSLKQWSDELENLSAHIGKAVEVLLEGEVEGSDPFVMK